MILDENFNPGAFESRPDPRQYKYRSLMAMGAVPTEFDWSRGYDAEAEHNFKLSESNQDGSLSCVGQTYASYGEGLEFIENKAPVKMSARAIYSHIFLPQGGAYLDDGAKFVTGSGFFTEADVPSYEPAPPPNPIKPPSEAFMRIVDDITAEVRKRALMYGSERYFYVDRDDIDQAALAIQNHNFIVMGATGSNPGWTQADVRPPVPGESPWGHAFLGIGAMMRNGKKCIKFKNHWGVGWGDFGYGYINEDYFKNGWTFSPIVLIDKKNIMANLIKLVKTPDSPSVYLVGVDGKYHPIVYEYFVLDLLGSWSEVKVDTVPSIPPELIGYPIGGYHR